jgi:hypothetical protein
LDISIGGNPYPKLGLVAANELQIPVSDPAHRTPTFLKLLSYCPGNALVFLVGVLMVGVVFAPFRLERNAYRYSANDYGNCNAGGRA